MDDVFDKLYEKTNDWSKSKKQFTEVVIQSIEAPWGLAEGYKKYGDEEYEPQTIGGRILEEHDEDTINLGGKAGAVTGILGLVGGEYAGANLFHQAGLDEYFIVGVFLPWIATGVFEVGRYVNKKIKGKYKEWRLK